MSRRWARARSSILDIGACAAGDDDLAGDEIGRGEQQVRLALGCALEQRQQIDFLGEALAQTLVSAVRRHQCELQPELAAEQIQKISGKTPVMAFAIHELVGRIVRIHRDTQDRVLGNPAALLVVEVGPVMTGQVDAVILGLAQPATQNRLQLSPE